MNIPELRKEMKFIADGFRLEIATFDISKDDEITVKFRKTGKHSLPSRAAAAYQAEMDKAEIDAICEVTDGADQE
jgi:hypothetical protein